MTRLVFTFAGWLVVAILFANTVRWVNARSRKLHGAGRCTRPPAPGGDARLPVGEEWPRSPSNPMSFIGELDLAALHRAAPEAAAALPDDGWLAFFYDVEEMPWGYDPSHGAFSRLLHLTGEREARSAPAGAVVYEERMLGARPVRVLPDSAELPGGMRLDEEADETYADFAAALLADPDHRVGGHPRWLQSDVRDDAPIGRAAAKVWHLLWQVDTDGETG